MTKILDFDENLKFGVEIEYTSASYRKILKTLDKLNKNRSDKKYDKWGYLADTNFSIVKPDEDIYGGEIQSRILKNKKEDLNELRMILENLNKLKASSDGKESIQIHVSDEVFNNDYNRLYNFIRIYAAYEDIIYKFGYNGKIPREVLMQYAMPCIDELYNIIKNSKNIKDFNYLLELLNINIINKAYGLSFVDVNRRDQTSSIEFRMFNQTLDYQTILNEINMTCNLLLSHKKEIDYDLVDYRLEKQKENLYDIRNYSKINIEKAKEFSDIIFSNQESKDDFIKQYTK